MFGVMLFRVLATSASVKYLRSDACSDECFQFETKKLIYLLSNPTNKKDERCVVGVVQSEGFDEFTQPLRLS